MVRQDPPQEKLANGLYVPQTASRELQEDIGTVVAIGPGALAGGARLPMVVAVGDRVMFRRRPGSALVPDAREGGREDWKDLVILDEEDIFAVIED